MRFLSDFHNWYDTLREPWRMLLALLIILVVVIIPINMGAPNMQALFGVSPLAGLVIALTGLILGLFLVSSRMVYLEKRDRARKK